MRFSKIVSDMTLSPSAVHMSTRNWACMSVGKPGCGAVVTFTARSGPVRRMRMDCPSAETSTPACRILRDERFEVCDLGALDDDVAASLIAAAHMYVPASMRSGMIAWSNGQELALVAAADVDDVRAGARRSPRPSC